MTAAAQRTVVVTGGARGIGRAVCTALAGPDTRLYFNYVSDRGGKETLAAVEAAGGVASAVRVDVSDAAQVDAFFKRIVKESGRLDVLVNNAGITRDGLLVRMKEADWDAVMDVNLKGAFNCMKAVAKTMMKQRYGRIVNISSVAAAGNPGQANYSSSKAGVVGLTKTLALELGSTGIRFNSILPSWTRTERVIELMEGRAQRAGTSVEEEIQKQAAASPIGRMAEPQEFANVAAFLVSPAASYLTGVMLPVDSGMYKGAL